jgi:hypothetical protein
VPLKTLGVIEIPNAAGSEFDHAATRHGGVLVLEDA